jgi:hypothetical protein
VAIEQLLTANRGDLYHRGLAPTPTDPLSGIAYPIMPYEGTLSEDNSSLHHAAHERNREELVNTENGVVIRTARMQRVYGPGGSLLIGKELANRHTPHQRYHYFCSGPEVLPVLPAEQFNYGVWAGSLYVPEYGLDVSGQKLKVKRLLPDQVQKLHDGQVKIGAIDTLRIFLRKYVMENGVPQTDESDIDRFMNTEDLDLRIKMGRNIMDAASRVVSEPLEVDFERARKKGRIYPQAGKCVAEVVHLNVTFGNQEKLVRQLTEAIAA